MRNGNLPTQMFVTFVAWTQKQKRHLEKLSQQATTDVVVTDEWTQSEQPCADCVSQ